MRLIIHFTLGLLLLSGCARDNQSLGEKAAQREVHQESYQGNITGYAFDEYKLQLATDEILTTNIDVRQLEVVVYSPVNVTLYNDQPLAIEADGEYTLRVLMPRAFARRGDSYNYRLLVQIEGGK